MRLSERRMRELLEDMLSAIAIMFRYKQQQLDRSGKAKEGQVGCCLAGLESVVRRLIHLAQYVTRHSPAHLSPATLLKGAPGSVSITLVDVFALCADVRC